MMRKALIAVLLAVVMLGLSLPAQAEPVFVVKMDRLVQPSPFTGRVYVVLTKGNRDPRMALADWFNPPQIFAVDVKDVPAGTAIEFDERAMHFPESLAGLKAGKYVVQAIARRNPDHWVPGLGEGDAFSRPTVGEWPLKTAPLTLIMDGEVSSRPVREAERVRMVEVNSTLLSDFYKRPITLRTMVILPRGWGEEAARTWPAVYHIDGFGSEPEAARRLAMQSPQRAKDVIIVAPNAGNYWGHSAFADSANIGPWGRALVEEVIPAVEKRYKGPAAPGGGGGAQRYVSGISSGGWAALWLQVTHPDDFAGVWAHSPDPVDFRDFQRINLYEKGANMFRDEKGERRPLAHAGDKVLLYYDEFVKRESILGPGGQIQSFEAVFSPRGKDGLPVPLFDRATGAVDPAVAKSWEAFDIRLKLEKNWAALEPKLKGKIHVYGGSEDNFYLDGAVRLLAESMAKLDPTAEVKVIPGMGHAMHQPAVNEMYAYAADHAIKAGEVEPKLPAVPTP